MRNLLLVYFICANINLAILSTDVNDESDLNIDSQINEAETLDDGNEDNLSADNLDVKKSDSGCWMTLNTPELFKIMDAIDDRYLQTRQNAQKALMDTHFDQTMIRGLVHSKGAALREVHKYNHKAWLIPSGFNLGGHCMMRMTDSIMFFHRMKLRNNTHFRVTGIHNDISNLVVMINLSLHDLHLLGAYERALTDTDPSVLIYAPSYGEVEFLLKNVKYRMEGRYRIIGNHLTIELVTSEINVEEVLMTYITQAIESASITVEKENLGAFMGRLKVDLDKWMKDYFNDYLIYVRIDGIEHMQELAKYDKEKTIALQEYSDASIARIKARLHTLNAEVIKLPNFTLKSVHGLQIKLYDGALHGLDSMYRRSVPTGFQIHKVRKLDTIIGFSTLKVVYKYEAIIPTGLPPLAGELTLTANEVAARLALVMVDDPETVDMDIEFLDQMKPESLTVEGPANTLIANFKHLLENEIVTLMSTSLIHGIELLRSLPRCAPFIPGQLVTLKPNPMTPKQSALTDDADNNDDSRNWLNDGDSDNIDNEIMSRKNRPNKAMLRSKNKKKTKKYSEKLSKKQRNKTYTTYMKYKNA